MRILTALLLCCAFALHAADLSQYKTDKNSWTDALIQGIAKERTLYIKPGTYKLDKAIEITKDIALIMEDGAKFMTDQKQMFVLKNGNFMIEGRGIPAELRSSATGDPRMVATDRASIIDLNNAPQDAVPSLEVRNVKFYAFHGIDGIKRPASTNKFGKLIVEKCQFFVTSYGVGIRCAEVGSARVENCLFEDVRFPIALSSPIHGGCIVRGNTLKRFGLAGIQIGKGGQISEGCTTHLSSAIVHDNQLLRGGIGEHEKASYTQGILVYGHNVSVQGNVVRDVHRGFPAPDRDFGRHYRTQDGKILTENWIYENGKRRRLAGAAIYLKANKAVVQGNVCTNSGWRSVIEIKTGGKEHFVTVVNNIVDGSALNTDDSFGFECNSGRSLWANNMVFNMPNQAFVVRSGYENTFINNVIVNAKVGFALSGNAPGYGEMISGNRFINVQMPVAIDGKTVTPNAAAPDVFSMPTARLAAHQELPEPCAALEGRIFVKGTKFYCCVKQGEEYVYMEMAGKIIPNKKYQVIDKELLFNADQSGKEKSDKKELNEPLHPGWISHLRSAREGALFAPGNITFDTKNFKTGGRSLKVCMVQEPGSWRLLQRVALKPGARYRATAVVKGEEALNLRLEVRPATGPSFIKRAADTKEWQTITMDFTNPANSSGGIFTVWSSKTNMHKNAWLDSVSLKELINEETAAEIARAAARKTIGPEMATGKWSLPKQLKCTQNAKGLTLERAEGKSNVVCNQRFTLKGGKDYRAVVKMVPDGTLKPKRVSFYVRFGKENSRYHLVPVDEKDGVVTLQADFTASVKEPKAAMNVWLNEFAAGDKLTIQSVSVKELSK